MKGNARRRVVQQPLQLIEKLLLNKNRIIIISGVKPTCFFETYRKEIDRLLLQEGPENKTVLLSRYENCLSRWKDIFSGFVKVYPGQVQRSRVYHASCTVENLITYECAASSYFQRLQPFLERLRETEIRLGNKGTIKMKESTSRKVKEEVLLKIQSMAQSYYFSLWNTCSKEEKYVLYDLADDGFVNTKNINTIILLLEKGLIFYNLDDQLRIMNESFRNFILTNVNETEALEMERERLQKGTYSILKGVIIIVVVGTLFFFSFAEQALLDSFLAILVALTALIPSLLRLGGWFGPSSSADLKV